MSVDVTLAADTAPGSVLVLGTDLAGVSQAGGRTGSLASVDLHGVFSLPKATTAGSGMAQGGKAYWDKVALKVVNATNANTVALGHIFRTAADADATVQVRLQPGA